MITRTVTLYPSTAFTTTAGGTGSAMAAQLGPSLPLTPAAGVKHGAVSMQVFFEVSVITSTQAQIDFTIQGRPVAGTGNWFTLQPLVGDASLAWVAVNNSTSLQVRRFMGPIPAEIRSVMTTSGTSPNYTASCYAVLGE